MCARHVGRVRVHQHLKCQNTYWTNLLHVSGLFEHFKNVQTRTQARAFYVHHP